VIAYAFAALTLPVAGYIGASAVLRVDLYIRTKFSLVHFENLNGFPDSREKKYISL